MPCKPESKSGSVRSLRNANKDRLSGKSLFRKRAKMLAGTSKLKVTLCKIRLVNTRKRLESLRSWRRSFCASYKRHRQTRKWHSKSWSQL